MKPKAQFWKTAIVALAVSSLFGGSSSIVNAQNAKSRAQSGFFFDIYGDSRSMMYLPYKASQEAEARKLMVDMFELVLPRKTSEEVVEKHVKLIYEPSTHELVQMVMPFDTMH